MSRSVPRASRRETRTAAGRPLPLPFRALAWLSVAALLASMCIAPISNNDVFIHLATGRYVLDNGHVPETDPYSFTASDRDYVAHEWLSGVLFQLVFSVAGTSGLILFKTIVVGAAFVLLLSASRLAGARTSVLLPVSAVVLYLASARFVERPHVFSYLLAALYLWLLFRWRDGGRERRWLWAILPAHVLWTNLHGGFVVGIALVGVFALGEGLHLVRSRLVGKGAIEPVAPRDVALLAALVPGCVAASLLNPYGPRILSFPFELTRLGTFMQRIYEWQPPFAEVYNASTMFVLFLIWLGALLIVFFLRFRDEGLTPGGWAAARLSLFALAAIYATLPVLWFLRGGMYWRPDVLATVLYGLLGLFALFCVVRWRSVDFTHAGLVGLLVLLSLRHNRAVTDAALGTVVTVSSFASWLLSRRRGIQGGARADSSARAAVLAGSGLLLAIAAITAVRGYAYDFRGTVRKAGFGIGAELPVCAVEFLARNGFRGNAFVAYSDAALVIHRLYPAVKVNMDSRNDVYGEALYAEYLGAFASPEAMREYLSRRPVDFFLFPLELRIPEIFDSLEATGEWVPVYFDDGWFVLDRRGASTEERIRREGFRVLRPFGLSAPEPSTSEAPVLLEEAGRVIRNCPSATLGYLRKSDALRALGRHREAIDASREALARDPGSVPARMGMAQSHAALGERDAAIEALRTLLRTDPTYAPALDLLRRLRGF